MNLQETYQKNKKKHLLNEVSATGATGTFVGRAGDIVDQLFAGGFHPEFGEIEKLLDKQIEDNIAIRMWTDDITPIADQDFIDLEWDYEYDENEEIDNSKFKTTDDKMQLVDIDIKYDKIMDNTEENKKFVNDTNDWKYIYNNKQ
jgi:hypothetical protein